LLYTTKRPPESQAAADATTIIPIKKRKRPRSRMRGASFS
jgi:hypothetical protein